MTLREWITWLSLRSARAQRHRLLLEGAAAEFEEAAPCYERAHWALSGFGWRDDFLAQDITVRWLIQQDTHLLALLETAQKRLAADGASRVDAVPLLLARVERARARLARLGQRRLGGQQRDRPSVRQVLVALRRRLGRPVTEREEAVPIDELPPTSRQRRVEERAQKLAERERWEQFLVRLHYREPTHELRTGVPQVFQLSLEVRAASATEAEARAHRELRRRWAQSGVGWVPEVVLAQVSAGGAVAVRVAPSSAPHWPVPPRVEEPREDRPGARLHRAYLRPGPRGSGPKGYWDRLVVEPWPGPSAGPSCSRMEARERPSFDPTTASRLLLELSEDLRVLGRQPEHPEWVSTLARALSREAWELAKDVWPALQQRPEYRAELALALDLSPRRVGAIVAALMEEGAPEDQLGVVKRFAARVEVLKQWMQREQMKGGLG